ncbi:MAG TPA: hypothetical protein PKK43_14480 [Spirochaetota bacterium]|nr:hypothetical protein [Spirochaetota bacterium]
MIYSTNTGDGSEKEINKRDGRTGFNSDLRQEFLENRLAELRKIISEIEENNEKRGD